MTLGERIDQALREAALTRVMRDVIRDQSRNPIAQGQTVLPETGTERPLQKVAIAERPIEPPAHVALCDRLMDAQDARDKQRR